MTFAEFQEAVLLGKSRSDCSSGCIDLLVETVARHKQSQIAGDIMECGSYRCGATIAMAAAAEYYETGKRVFAFDLWNGLPYGPGVGFENFGDVDFAEILEATAPFTNIVKVQGKHEESVPDFVRKWSTVLAPSHLPLVSLLFMDSDFYDSHVVCLRSIWPLITARGGVIFHDWHFQGVQQAITDAVNIKEYNRYDLPHNMGMIVKT